MRERVCSNHPLAMAFTGLVEITIEGKRLSAHLGALGIDQFKQILLIGTRLRHDEVLAG